MTIRCAILVVVVHTDPLSEDVIDGVRSFLRENLPAVYFLEERRVASDRHLIEAILRGWCDEEDVDLALTIGGTFPAPGHSAEQITPEATAAVIERAMPSLPESMRAYAAEDEPTALLDRGVSGIRTRTLIVNLPGYERLAPLFLAAIVDLITPILARLQPAPESVRPLLDDAQPLQSKQSGLDADEFAAFLAQRREDGSV